MTAVVRLPLCKPYSFCQSYIGEGLEPQDMSRKCMIYWKKKRYRFGFIVMQPRKEKFGLEKPTKINFCRAPKTKDPGKSRGKHVFSFSLLQYYIIPLIGFYTQLQTLCVYFESLRIVQTTSYENSKLCLRFSMAFCLAQINHN